MGYDWGFFCLVGCFFCHISQNLSEARLKINGPDTKMHLNIISFISMKFRVIVIIAHLAAEPFELVHN